MRSSTTRSRGGARRAADLGFDEAVALALEYPGAIPAMQNGILIVEFANKLQEEGQAKVDAVRNAAMTRLRPVLMTSVATVCGHFPLTLVTGPGASARNSIGLVLVAGMAVGTLFTLFFVPAPTCSSRATTGHRRRWRRRRPFVPPARSSRAEGYLNRRMMAPLW